jgi:thiol-disulfide isomerase/thioredoxin
MRSLFLILITLLSAGLSIAQNVCTLKGKIINRDSKAILLRRSSDGMKLFMNNPQKLPIRNGAFKFSFNFRQSEAYELIFEDELEQGSWIPIRFFSEKGEINFTLYPKNEYKKNIVIGGRLNSLYAEYLSNIEKQFSDKKSQLFRLRDSLLKNDAYDSDEYKNQLAKLRATKSGDQDAKVPIYQKMDELQKTYACYTETAKSLFVFPYDSLMKEEVSWKYNYIKNNISLVAYYLLYFDVETQMKTNPILPKLVEEVFPIYAKKYPDHIYTKNSKTQLDGLRAIRVGNKFADLKAPSVLGDSAMLSNLIRNKIALIDFWGSWCGPCIAKSRLVVPVYDQYRTKGFEVVGIAREFENLDALKERLAKEKFSWPHLFDLNDQLGIWKTYGINNGVGMMVLVDRDGTILAIDPKSDELAKILATKLN